jgi:hypothetical protein
MTQSGQTLENIVTEFDIPIKIRLIKMCLNQIYSKVSIGKYLSYKFNIQNGLKQGHALSLLLFNFALVNPLSNVLENKEGL